MILGVIEGGPLSEATTEEPWIDARFTIRHVPIGRGGRLGDVLRKLEVDAVLFPAPPGAGIVAGVLSSGIAVLCPESIASTPPELEIVAEAEAAGRGVLVVPGLIRSTFGGGMAARALGAHEIGQLLSVYLSVRAPKAAQRAVPPLSQLTLPAFDYLADIVTSTTRRLYATTDHLFSADVTDDSAIVILRTTDETVATVELSRCLPTTYPLGGPFEIEIELVGTDGSIRARPFQPRAITYGDQATKGQPLTDSPLFSLLNELAEAVDTGRSTKGWYERTQRVIRWLEAMRISIETHSPVEFTSNTEA